MRVGCMNVMVNETGSGTLGYVVRKLPSLRAISHCGQRIEEAKGGLRETGDARAVEFTVKFASAYFVRVDLPRTHEPRGTQSAPFAFLDASPLAGRFRQMSA